MRKRCSGLGKQAGKENNQVIAKRRVKQMSNNQAPKFTSRQDRAVPGTMFLKHALEVLRWLSEKPQHGLPLMSRQRSAWRAVVEPTLDVSALVKAPEAPGLEAPRHEVIDLLNLAPMKFSR